MIHFEACFTSWDKFRTEIFSVWCVKERWNKFSKKIYRAEGRNDSILQERSAYLSTESDWTTIKELLNSLQADLVKIIPVTYFSYHCDGLYHRQKSSPKITKTGHISALTEHNWRVNFDSNNDSPKSNVQSL